MVSSLRSVVAVLFALYSAADVGAFVNPTSKAVPRFSCKEGFVLGAKTRIGLAYEDFELGQGRRILPGDTVYCYYIGSFKQGGRFGAGETDTIFDEISDGPPFSFVVGKGEVIQGMDLGILGGLDGEITPMNVGGIRKLFIPSKLAYGSNGVGTIPPNQDLEFKLEILDAGKVSDISLQYRLGGYAVALGIPAIILFIGYNLLSGNWL